MGGFFHLKKERLGVSLGSIFSHPAHRIFIQKNAAKAHTKELACTCAHEKNRPLIRHIFRLQNQKPPEWRHHLFFGPQTQKNYAPHG